MNKRKTINDKKVQMFDTIMNIFKKEKHIEYLNGYMKRCNEELKNE